MCPLFASPGGRSGGDTASDLGAPASSRLTSGAAAAHLGKFYLSAQIASVTDLTAQLHHRDVHTCWPKERGGGDRDQELRLQFDGENIFPSSQGQSCRQRGSAGVFRAEACARPAAERPACCVHLPSIDTCRLTGSCFNWTSEPKPMFQLDRVKPAREPTETASGRKECALRGGDQFQRLQPGGGSRHVHALSFPQKNKT